MTRAYPLPSAESKLDRLALPRLEGGWLRLTRAAWVVLALAAVAALAASLPGYAPRFAGQLAHLASENPGTGIRLIAATSALVSLASALLSMALALMLFRNRFEEPAAAALSFYLLIYAVVMAGPLEHLGAYWFDDVAFAVSLQGALLAAPTIALFALFPNGRFVPRWMRWVVALSLPLSIALILLFPLDLSGKDTEPASLYFLGAIYASFFLAAVYAQIYRYRRVSTPEERRQTKWPVFGFALWFAYVCVSTVPYLYLSRLPAGVSPPWWTPASELSWWVSLNIIPVSLTISITRHRLWDIDLIINRTLVYGALTACVLALYALVIGGFSLLFRSSGSLPVSLLATGLAAVLFQPLRDRLQGGVNRMMYGERDDPVALLSRLGKEIEWAGTPSENLVGIAGTVARALKLPYVAIELGDEGPPEAEYGLPRNQVVGLPLVYQGERVGSLQVSLRDQESSLSPKDRELLQEIARHAGALAYSARLTSDLQMARQRLVTSREEERRRLRNDLHDGLGPELASLALRLDAARNLLATDPEKVKQLLQESKSQVQEALEDIRRLVHNLRPPALDQLGLVPALRQHAERMSAVQGIHVEVEASSDIPALPAAVEVAAYRIVLEAVNNAVHHGKARHCRIAVRVEDGLTIEVADDGEGLPAEMDPGVGITSMRERSMELGGRFQIASLPEGGTRVSVWLPTGEGEA
jgi:signal transduction histidine kinase